MEIPAESIEQLDEGSFALYLEVPGSKVVLLQAYFELYEGVGVVRTVDIRTSRVCIVTTKSLLQDCLTVLESIHEKTGWKFTKPPAEAAKKEERPWLTAARH